MYSNGARRENLGEHAGTGVHPGGIVATQAGNAASWLGIAHTERAAGGSSGLRGHEKQGNRATVGTDRAYREQLYVSNIRQAGDVEPTATVVVCHEQARRNAT